MTVAAGGPAPAQGLHAAHKPNRVHDFGFDYPRICLSRFDPMAGHRLLYLLPRLALIDVPLMRRRPCLAAEPVALQGTAAGPPTTDRIWLNTPNPSIPLAPRPWLPVKSAM